MDRADQVGAGGDQLVEHGALRDAAGEQERADGAVGEERAGREALVKPGSCVHLLQA